MASDHHLAHLTPVDPSDPHGDSQDRSSNIVDTPSPEAVPEERREEVPADAPPLPLESAQPTSAHLGLHHDVMMVNRPLRLTTVDPEQLHMDSHERSRGIIVDTPSPEPVPEEEREEVLAEAPEEDPEDIQPITRGVDELSVGSDDDEKQHRGSSLSSLSPVPSTHVTRDLAEERHGDAQTVEEPMMEWEDDPRSGNASLPSSPLSPVPSTQQLAEEHDDEDGGILEEGGESVPKSQSQPRKRTSGAPSQRQHTPPVPLRAEGQDHHGIYQERHDSPQPHKLRSSRRDKPAKDRKSNSKRKEKAVSVERSGFRVLENSSDVSGDDESALPNIRLSDLHPTLFADLKLFSSSNQHPMESFKYIPFQIVKPGDVNASFMETEYLAKLEESIRASDKDGLPPHLSPDANSLSYPESTSQSRICVLSYNQYIALKPVEIQGIFRHRHILVRDVSLEHEYGWDIDSLGTVWDVDKPTTIQVGHYFDPMNPELRQLPGTLRELHTLTTTCPCPDDPPPLNAISLPMGSRNLFLPSQWGSLASHEVAQSRAPKKYTSVFNVPDLRDNMHWALVGAKRAFSPLHIDAEGLCTLVQVLHGSKYWMIVTKMGEDEDLSSIDSLGPNWDPYLVAEDDRMKQFKFEGVHLKPGDMFIMRPGTLHAVLGTANSICVGRHFYATNTIQLSVISIIHTALLQGSVTNEEYLESRSFLFQLMFMWADRLATDVDKAHFPDLSTEDGFFDALFLGIFIILAPAFDNRYRIHENRPQLGHEIALAKSGFISLMQLFNRQFFVMLDGQLISHMYIVHRLLAEVAATAVLFADEICQFGIKMAADRVEADHETQMYTIFKKQIESAIKQSYPEIWGYYIHQLSASDRRFCWSGGDVDICIRSHDLESSISHIFSGEIPDALDWPIYVATDDTGAARRNRSDSMAEESSRPKKKKR